MSLRVFIAFILPFIFLWLSVNALNAQIPARQVLKVHQRAIVIDTHTDTPLEIIKGDYDPGIKHPSGSNQKVDFPRLLEGGVDAVFFALFTRQNERTRENYEHAYEMANRMLQTTLKTIQGNSRTVDVALSTEDIPKITADKKTAIFFGMENGFPLAKDLSRIQEFYNKGVRYITLCHSLNNDICDSSTDPEGSENNGLSDYGKEVVAEMNRLGMMVDVSHISDKAFYDVLAVTKAPVIASHSSVRALCGHPRNMSDDMIQALARNGGVIQICMLGAYLVPEDTTSINYLKMNELKNKYHNWQYRDEAEHKRASAEWDSVNKLYPPFLPKVADAVDHIDHVVKLVGVDYVGIGSDFDGGGELSDCRDIADFPAITAELLKRGYSRENISKIWGGNFLRVFGQVEKLSQTCSTSALNNDLNTQSNAKSSH
jgi:membrane dipeptidase